MGTLFLHISEAQFSKPVWENTFFQRNIIEKMKNTVYFHCSLSVDPSDVSSAKDFSFLLRHFIA